MDGTEGRTSIDYLIDRGRLERIQADDPLAAAMLLIERSRRRLRTAELALDDGDTEGGFVAAYDAFRMSADALLLAQSLRATGGDGSHIAVADAVSAQFGDATPEFRRVTFDRLRRTRHAIQYSDPTAAETTTGDATWAITTASSAIDAANRILDGGSLSQY